MLSTIHHSRNFAVEISFPRLKNVTGRGIFLLRRLARKLLAGQDDRYVAAFAELKRVGRSFFRSAYSAVARKSSHGSQYGLYLHWL
jgi:hypothetical protein